MPCAQYCHLSYHLAAQLSKLLSIKRWQWWFSCASLCTSGGLNRFYISLIPASPFSKHGIVIPLDEYIIFTNIKILFWCFRTALNPKKRYSRNFLK
jgi:hypothetical protein